MKKLTAFVTLIIASAGFSAFAAPPLALEKLQPSEDPAKTVSQRSVRHRVTDPQTGYTPIRVLKDRSAFAAGKIMGKQAPASRTEVRRIKEADPNATYPDLHASVTTYSDDGYRSSRVAKLPTKQSDAFETKCDYVYFSRGGVEVNRKYYGIVYQNIFGDMWDASAYCYNTNTWEYETMSHDTPKSLFASDLAWNPVDNKIYGCFEKDPDTEGEGYVFGTVDYENNQRTKICDLTDQWNGFAIDSSGNGYAIDMQGNLLKVNLADGSTTQVGSTGLKPYYAASATIDLKTNRMFYAILTEEKVAGLYEIDTTNGEATHIITYDNSEEIHGMFILKPLAEADAPATPLNVEPKFENGSLTGTMEFDVPATLYGGDPATGSVEYVISSGNLEAELTGTVAYGTHASIPVTVKGKAKTEFLVYLKNDKGKSPDVNTSSLYIGPGEPSAPKTATLTVEGTKASLVWTAVTEAKDRYYFDPEGIVYTVTRMPENVKVYEGTEVSFSETLPGAEGFRKLFYTVNATSKAGITSSNVTSNGVGVGNIVPPYSETFASRGDDSGYTVINANSDNKTWGYTGSYGGGMNAPYNSKLASDDWLITPPVEMTKGYSYKITLKIKGTGSARSEEKFEMSGGTAPTVEGMATKIIEPTIMTGNTQNTYEVYFTATETRPYYFGVHAISDPNKYGILVNGLTIDKGTTPLAPDAVTFVKSVTDYNGEPKATITVKAPLLAGDGTELPGITKIDVKMGDEVVKTFNNVTPGSEFSFDMTVDKDGAYDLTFVPYLEENEGKTLTQNVYIGMGVPSSVATTAIVEDSEKTGTANLTWSAVNTDVNGASLNPDLFTYTITTMDASGQEVTIAKDISDTSYSVKEVSDGEQAFVSYMIYAVNRVGSSEAVQTDMIPVGTPYEVPFIESFANRQASHAFVQGCLRGLQNDAWGVSGDTDIIDFTSYDHDNGFAVLLAYDTEIYALYSAKIDLSGIENPSLSYYTFCIDADDVNILTSQISLDGVNWITLKENIENELPKIGWNRISVSLDEYKGKTVQFRWVGEVELYSHIFLDNIRIEKGLNCDAAATSITAPQKAEASSDYVISATVENLSSGRELKDVTVNLYKNGNKIDEKQIETIGIDGTETVEFNQTASLIEEKDNTFYIDVMTEGDENSDNNATATVTVTTKMPNHPAVTTLEGSLTDNYNNVSLTWAEPDLSHALKDPYTETFESAETSTVFPNTFGDWTFVDKDMKPIGGVKNLSLPGIETGSRQSYFVVDNTYDDFSHFDAKSFEAHSGTKYLSNMYLGEGGRVNDWAISPELPGCEQEISFYVKNADERYSETFEFLYSTTDMENFIMVSEHEVGNCDWNRFVYTVPEGTKYFAIRCKSNSKLMMFIDDVTYIPTGVATDYEIEGYNIYRDGLKLNDAPVKATAYNDILESAGTYTYCVTTIYKGKGESKASNKVKVEATLGIHNVYGSKKAVSTDNYDTLGRLIVGNPFPGTVVITKTKYDDGSVTVSKHIAR